MLISKRANLVEFGDIAIHGKNAVTNNQFCSCAISIRLPKLLFQVFHIGIFEAIAHRLAKANAVNDRGVVQSVRNDCVFLAEERLKDAAIGVKTRGKREKKRMESS